MRNLVFSYGAGFLFGLGWWFLIDANAISNFYRFESGMVQFIHYLPCIFSTLSLILLNVLPVEGFDMSAGADVSPLMRFWIFLAFCMAFGGVFGGTYLMIANYLINVPSAPGGLDLGGDVGLLMRWPGIAVFLQNWLIFAANLMMRFGRKKDSLF